MTRSLPDHSPSLRRTPRREGWFLPGSMAARASATAAVALAGMAESAASGLRSAFLSVAAALAADTQGLLGDEQVFQPSVARARSLRRSIPPGEIGD